MLPKMILQGNMDNTGVSFPDAAQAQHAKNIATQAAMQHPDVICVWGDRADKNE